MRANDKPLRTSMEPEPSIARVHLVRKVTVPSQAGKTVKAEIESRGRKGEYCTCVPDINVLESSGLSIPETVLTIDDKGRVYIPLQNLQKARVKLHRGAVLAQKQPDGTVHPIAYASRFLQPAERNYGISKLETLGLVWAVKHFRPYILGYPCTVYTDQAACLSLPSFHNPSTKLARWTLTIQKIYLTIKYRSGKKNTNADALSRNPVSPTDEVTTVLSVIATNSDCSCENALPPEVQQQCSDIRKEQRSDPDLLPLIEYLENSKLPPEEQASKRIVMESPKFDLIDGVLYFEYPSSPHQWFIVVPKHLQQMLLEESHSGQVAGHFAERKVYDRLRRYYWWKGIHSDIRHHC